MKFTIFYFSLLLEEKKYFCISSIKTHYFSFLQEWGECMEENNMGWKGLISFITCKQPLDKMNQCLSSCYKDKAFREECKEIYLDKRARYRATGIMDPDPYYKKPYYESEKKKEFLDKYRSEKKKKENESSMHEKESSST